MNPFNAYLDNNATTKVAPEVVDAMMPFLTEHYGNPSSIHSFGHEVGKAIEKARGQVQSLLGAQHSSEIVFTSCATEATNTAILSAIEAFPAKKEIVTSVVEHPATLQLCQMLERKGYTIHYIGVDRNGRLDLNAYANALNTETAIVSIQWANNETGTLFPIKQLAALANEHGILFHCDAVQVAGKIPFNVKETAIDFLSISGHKFHAPKGIGALYIRRGTKFRPMLRGGHQERGRRAGTENAVGIIAMGKSAELAEQSTITDTARITLMRNRLEQSLIAKIPNCFVTGDRANRVPNTSTIAFEYVEGEAILLMLNQLGIAASSGSACTSGSLEPSHVMRAMDIPYTAAHGAIRFSLSRFNQEQHIDAVLQHLPSIIKKLRLMSPYWQPDENNVNQFEPAFT
ncbi:cysteine desulfurase NifS [Echinimonas agarilytica]|uniref:Cysteine desulfurase n=1 Tax=Echinimonas agarilytica TaxID=1215918 RepID=A0AA42B8P2_9GAMM|nr:cysteine desulfurase NifS [Echinimonas agarilytica]MCM2680441.1 cysteine desulfurase NifS [Echinimonas agarilytica]